MNKLPESDLKRQGATEGKGGYIIPQGSAGPSLGREKEQVEVEKKNVRGEETWAALNR